MQHRSCVVLSAIPERDVPADGCLSVQNRARAVQFMLDPAVPVMPSTLLAIKWNPPLSNDCPFYRKAVMASFD
jgi:hypothetical protein